MPEIAISTRTRLTPYSQFNSLNGVKSYSVYNHMLIPTNFRGLEQDYWHLCNHVQLWDVSCERQVEIKGRDAAKLTQLMTPRNLSKIKINQCAYAPIIDDQASILNDPIILKLAEDRFWLSLADSDILLLAKGLAYGRSMKVEIFEPDINPLAIQGPKAEDLMVKVFGDEIRSIKFFWFKEIAYKDKKLIIARSGWSKQGGFEIYLDNRSLAEPLWLELWAAGEEFNVGIGCPNLPERIESGLLSYGNDMTIVNNPYECGLDRYCDITSDIDYMGRDALIKISQQGIQRGLRGIIFDDANIPACIYPWNIYHQETVVGEIRSACLSPKFKKALGLGIIHNNAWDVGTRVEIETVTETEKKRVKGTISAVPFTDI